MKKFFMAVTLTLAFGLVLAFTGCWAGMVTSEVVFYQDGSGQKTIAVEILGDESPLPGAAEGDSSTVGNNSLYLLLSGDALKAKIEEYCPLEDAEIEVEENGNDQLVTLTYSFSSVAEYNEKTKTLAGKYAAEIVDATFVDNGDGTFTFSEATDNTNNSILEIMEKIYADDTVYDTFPDGQADMDKDASGVASMYKVMSVKATLGDQSTTVEVHKNVAGLFEPVEQADRPDTLTVTGTPAEKPEEGGNSGGDTQKGGCSGSIALTAGASVAVAAVLGAAVILAVKARKQEKN